MNFETVVRLSFHHNNRTYEDTSAVLPSYDKPLILGMPFIKKYSSELNFNLKTLGGTIGDLDIALLDAQSFLKELADGEVGLLFIRREDDDIKVEVGDLPTTSDDIVQQVRGMNKEEFAPLLREYADVFKTELDLPPPHRGARDPAQETFRQRSYHNYKKYLRNQPILIVKSWEDFTERISVVADQKDMSTTTSSNKKMTIIGPDRAILTIDLDNS
ncbi:hypothetical protein Cantr_10253 [Candida viswanathii]|uniref:Uncharacterized protein n=1 Tax=Candida viswanathii TaxID=5486 RepID=A0A367YCM5_9ASCO|nr:hypothetical protein Cantr_10253 [Candida viswanathii]